MKTESDTSYVDFLVHYCHSKTFPDRLDAPLSGSSYVTITQSGSFIRKWNQSSKI